MKIQKKISGGGGGGGGRSGEGQVGGSGWWGGQGLRVNVNAMLGVGGDVGYGGCEQRIEGIIQCTKRYCSILRKAAPVAEWVRSLYFSALNHSIISPLCLV